MKFKILLIAELEYDIDPIFYPEEFTSDKMLETDLDFFLREPELLLDRENCNYTVTGKIIL